MIVLLLWLWLTSLVMLIGDLLNLTVGRAMSDRQKEKLAHRLQTIEDKHA